MIGSYIVCSNLCFVFFPFHRMLLLLFLLLLLSLISNDRGIIVLCFNLNELEKKIILKKPLHFKRSRTAISKEDPAFRYPLGGLSSTCLDSSCGIFISNGTTTLPLLRKRKLTICAELAKQHSPASTTSGSASISFLT